MGAPSPTSAARQLQAGLDSFRHRVRDAQLIKMAGVLGVLGAGHDHDLWTDRADDRHNLVHLRSRVDGQDDGFRFVEAAAFEKSRTLGVAEIGLASQLARLRDSGGVAIGEHVGDIMRREHVGHEPSYPATTDH